MKKQNVTKLVITALCISLGILIPFFFHNIPNFGKVFLPMHIPVLVCAFICGYKYGIACGAITPLLSSILTSMPSMPVVAIPMTVELITYAVVASFLYKKFNVYFSLIGAMIAGRLVLGLFSPVFLGLISKPFSFSLFITTSFVTAIPGIILQIVVIPVIIIVVKQLKRID